MQRFGARSAKVSVTTESQRPPWKTLIRRRQNEASRRELRSAQNKPLQPWNAGSLLVGSPVVRREISASCSNKAIGRNNVKKSISTESNLKPEETQADKLVRTGPQTSTRMVFTFTGSNVGTVGSRTFTAAHDCCSHLGTSTAALYWKLTQQRAERAIDPQRSTLAEARRHRRRAR